MLCCILQLLSFVKINTHIMLNCTCLHLTMLNIMISIGKYMHANFVECTCKQVAYVLS